MMEGNKRSNILVIVADQLRYDCIGYSKKYPVHTPHLDRLASEGMWFSSAYTPIPICSPARQCFLNGRRPESFGSLWNYDNGLQMSALAPTEYAWPRALQSSGYYTVHMGKWGVNPLHGPEHYGFSEYVNYENYKQVMKEKYANLTFSGGYSGESNPVPLEDSQTHWLSAKARQQIRKQFTLQQPWLISLNFQEPHLPCRPSEPFTSMYTKESVPMWGSFEETFVNKPYIQKQQLYNWGMENHTWEDWAPIVARYYATISQLDDAVGRVLGTLDELGIADDTTVIFTADHGDLCGGHRMMDKHYVLYDDVVRVPLIIKSPGMTKPGSVCDSFVHNMLDLPPTILEMLGLDIPDSFHGHSLQSLMRGEEVSSWREEAVSTYNGQQFGLYTQRMIRNQEWKYVWNTTDVDELYHLIADPHELTNEIYNEQHIAIVKDLRGKLYTTLFNEGDGLVRNEWMKRQLLSGSKL